MTADKARKSATRQRMAETGEPYSVARHAVHDDHDDDVELDPDVERAAEEQYDDQDGPPAPGVHRHVSF